MDKGIYRIIDANLNRLMEALRVCEDIVRFASDDEDLTRLLKVLRHDVFSAIRGLRQEHLRELIESRNLSDVGLRTTKTEKKRSDISDLFFANAQRGKESLRVLEEVMKLIDEQLSQKFKDFRFELYEVEKRSVKHLEDLRDN